MNWIQHFNDQIVPSNTSSWNSSSALNPTSSLHYFI